VTLRLALLGDSIAFGVGASRSADTLASRLAADLAGAGIAVDTAVFAVPGAVSSDLTGQVRRALSWRPDVAVVVIGANDLTRLVPPERSATLLGETVRSLRAAGAQVVVAPAPDLSVVPHVPPAARQLVRVGSALLRRAQVGATVSAGGVVADVEGATSAAFAADRSLFSRDLFHPSSAGYALIAGALSPVVRAAAQQVQRASGSG
jgi:lysophospholipase L1-like esterase